MNTAKEYVKFGGCLGFTAVFLLVLLKDRDVVAAVFDASIACLVMAYAFKLLHSYTVTLHNQVIRAKRANNTQEIDDASNSNLQSLPDRSVESS